MPTANTGIPILAWGYFLGTKVRGLRFFSVDLFSPVSPAVASSWGQKKRDEKGF